MLSTRRIVSFAAALATAGVVMCSAALAQQFVPFTEVQNVCPDCEPDRFDRISLDDGRTIEAWVLVEMPTFLLVRRHGELRAVPRGSVLKIDRAKRERPQTANYKDIILLKNGHALAGSITEQRPNGEYFRLVGATGQFTYDAFRVAIDKVFKSGQEVTLPSS